MDAATNDAHSRRRRAVRIEPASCAFASVARRVPRDLAPWAVQRRTGGRYKKATSSLRESSKQSNDEGPVVVGGRTCSANAHAVPSGRLPVRNAA
ncbi:hypothetical protein [Burkholderia pseudomallei]|uniref:hypothetical protein n=1 Tax=Burkholderia pseudomallei TaxID=28450 RepID=UPI0009B1F387|nr:hypothetical protein [Burkholderia pseudomallei]